MGKHYMLFPLPSQVQKILLKADSLIRLPIRQLNEAYLDCAKKILKVPFQSSLGGLYN